MSLHAHDAGGTPTVVLYCRRRGCRPCDRKKGEPCPRCLTWQSYPDNERMGACLRWNYRAEMIAGFWTFDQNPLMRMIEEASTVQARGHVVKVALR